MKQSCPNAFALALALTAGALFAPACGDDGGGADQDAAASADAPQGADSGPPPDAALPDAVPPGEATITINDPEGSPVEGVDVVFHDQTGAVISLKATDMNGQATEVVPGGALITVAVSPEAGVFNLNTLGDVQPGDQIVVSDFGPTGGSDPTEAGVVGISWPGAVMDAENYRVTEGCNVTEDPDPNTNNDLAVSTACQHGNGEFHVIAQAFIPSQGITTPAELLATSVLLDETLPNGGQALSLPAWNTEFQSATGTIMNPPAGAAAFGTDGNFLLDGHTFNMVDDDIGLGSAPPAQAIVPQGITPDSVNLTGAAVFLDGMMPTGINGLQVNVAGLPQDDVALDFAEAPRPATDGTLDPSDPARPVIAWNAEGSAGAADLTQLSLSWTGTVGGDPSEHSWNVLTNPNENGPFQFPELPEELSDFAPTADSTLQANMSYLASSFVTEDWDTLRQQGGQPAAEQPASDFTVGFSFPQINMASAPGPAPRPDEGSAARFLRWAEELGAAAAAAE